MKQSLTSGGAARPASAFREGAGIILVGILIGFAANALSPHGIPLVGDFSGGAAMANRSEKEIAALPAEVDVEAVEAAIAGSDTLLVLLLDARAREEYEGGHIPGALNLPAEAFDDAYAALVDTLNVASRLIVYCDGGDCELSHDLSALLKENGHKAVQLFTAGITGWIESGKPITVPEESQEIKQ